VFVDVLTKKTLNKELQLGAKYSTLLIGVFL